MTARGLLWLLAALALSLSVLALNRVPLYYFDSAFYRIQGDSIISFLMPDAPVEKAAAAGGGEAATPEKKDNQVNINRAAVYALMVALAWLKGPPYAIVLLNLAGLFVTAFLCARAASRSTGLGTDTLTLVSAPIAIGALTALPFYVAFVMPDIFAPVAILVMAAVVAFSRVMRPWELILAFALLAFAVVVHRSHLVIVGLAVPLALVAVLFSSGRRWWIVTGMIAAAALAGVAELRVYSLAAEKATGKEASIAPFMTARLIQDGPGWAYLQEHCPDAAIPTCTLADALSQSDDPWRLTASHIIFERSKELGSYARLSPDDQLRVARDQRAFFLAVLAERPVGVLSALALNTLRQTVKDSITMTVPDERVQAGVEKALGTRVDFGRLTSSRDWIRPIDYVHGAIYVVSLAVILGLFFAPGLMTREMRVFAAFVIAGILLNAFVCGAISQPAERYGGRVIWLLPYLAAFMGIVALRRRAAEEPARGLAHGVIK